MYSKVSSHCLRSYIKTTQSVLKEYEMVVYFPERPCTGVLQEDLIGPLGSGHVEGLKKQCYKDSSVVGCIGVSMGKLFLLS
jgi:hypothetical protein